MFEATRPISMRPDATRPRPDTTRPRPRPNNLASRPHRPRSLNIPANNPAYLQGYYTNYALLLRWQLHILHDPRAGFWRISLELHTAQGSISMASAERELITGVWGLSPQRGFRGTYICRTPVGIRGQSTPEAECLFVFASPKEAANLPNYW